MKPTCNCRNCNAEGVVSIPLNRRGSRNVYLCNFHAYRLESYTFENDFRLGSEKVHGYTYGMEFETSYSTLKARAELIANSFIPTHDATVNAEYKSPIMQGLNSLSKQVRTYDELIAEGELRIGNECGTHFHVGGEFINVETISYMKRFYHSLFLPLCAEMQANPDGNIRFFGRDFTYYASPINEHSNPDDHCNFINLQHSYSMEFRLCKYINGSQYMNCVKFCDEVAKTVVENFIKHFNDDYTDKNRYPTMTDYRKHKAQVAAQKLVKIYRKYAGLN